MRQLVSPRVGVVATILTVYFAAAAGVAIPGRGYARKVLNDPYVFGAVRGLVIVGSVYLGLLLLWHVVSISAYIKNHRWIRNPGGFEHQEIHRGRERG